MIPIFITGKRVDRGELTIYDATGNVINKINIADVGAAAPGRPLSDPINPARRIVGSWDLKDRKGRVVSDGTYLLRGVVKTADGRRERVSVVVGVR